MVQDRGEIMGKIRKALITAAGRDQRPLALQRFSDGDGREGPALGILARAAVDAGCEKLIVVVAPGDEAVCRSAIGEPGAELELLVQQQARGYGHAVLIGQQAIGDEPFLHMVGDHLWVSNGELDCARQVVEMAENCGCAVSGVQATREWELPKFGVVGGQLAAGAEGLYEVERVVEKPSPTLAEQELVVPGLRAGRYLCFFGLHVLTPSIFQLLGQHLADLDDGQFLSLSPALDQLAKRERYLALEMDGERYDLGGKHGPLIAQLALALSGADRGEVLARLVELLARRDR